MILQMMAIGLVLMFVMTAEAKTIYVNNSGSPACNDATTYANNDAENPWCTIARAAWGSTTRSSPNASEAATAGDTVLVTAGTYSINYSAVSPFGDIAYNPANTGTAGNYLTFRGVGTVTLTNTCTLPCGGPLIGASGKSYIHWDKFTIDEANAKPFYDINGYSYGLAEVTGGSYNIMEHLTLIGDPTISVQTDVHHLMFFQGTSTETGNTIRNSMFRTCIRAATLEYDPNGGGVMTYGQTGTVIEHNEFDRCGAAIFDKNAYCLGDSTQCGYDHIIRYNLIYGTSLGIVLQENRDTKVYGNIIRDCYNGGADLQTYGIKGQGESVVRAIITNNTVENCGQGVNSTFSASDPWENVQVNNSIFYGVQRPLQFENSTAFSGYFSSNRNVFYTFDRFGIAGTDYMTFAAWQGNPNSSDPDSINSDPTFTNVSGNNFHLQVGSPALTLGRVIGSICGTNGDTIPAGAYCTGTETIGVESSSTTRSFSPLLNLRRAGLLLHTEEFN